MTERWEWAWEILEKTKEEGQIISKEENLGNRREILVPTNKQRFMQYRNYLYNEKNLG